MKRLFLVVLLLALAGGGIAQPWKLEIDRTEPTVKVPAEGIGIKGKWGLGVGVGADRWAFTGAEASLIRGKTEKSALILDLSVFESYMELTGASSGVLTERRNNLVLETGPRFRKFSRPASNFSPYLDWYVHATGTSAHNETYYEESGSHSTNNTTQLGGELGLDFGVEYFTPWHFSLAAHSGLMNFSASRVWRRQWGSNSRERGFTTSLGFGPAPRLNLRVYF